jgi:hypothetical protein
LEISDLNDFRPRTVSHFFQRRIDGFGVGEEFVSLPLFSNPDALLRKIGWH